MTDILNLTSYDAIRAAWGVTRKDVPDAIISGNDLDMALEVDLAGKGISYEAIVAAGTAEGAEAAARRQYFYLRQYALHYCARKLVSAVHLSVLQAISDGNVSGRRFNEKSIDKAIKEVKENYVSALADLNTEFSLTAFTAPLMATKATPSADPVTGV